MSRHRKAVLFLVFFAPFFAGLATAQPKHVERVVAFVEGSPSDTFLAQVGRRIRGELAAARFSVVEVKRNSVGHARQVVETAGFEEARGILAAMLLLRDGDAVELWISDRVHSRTGVTRVMVDQVYTADIIEKVAFSSVEMLRASLAEAWTEAPVPSSSVVVVAPSPAVLLAAPVRQVVTSILAFGEALAIPRAGVLAWGAGGSINHRWGSVLSAGAALGAYRGSVQARVARTDITMAIFGLGVGAAWGSGPVSFRTQLGMRMGLVRLVPDVVDLAYAAATGVGPWAGPSTTMALDFAVGPRGHIELALDGGWALWSTRGTFPQDSTAELVFGGPFLGVRMSAGASL